MNFTKKMAVETMLQMSPDDIKMSESEIEKITIPILYKTYIDAGKKVTEYYCMKCGKHNTVAGDVSNVFCCDGTVKLQVGYCTSSEPLLFAIKEDFGYKIYGFDVTVKSFKGNENDGFGILEKKVNKKILPMIYTEKHGLMMLNESETNVAAAASYAWENAHKKLQNNLAVNMLEDFKTIREEVTERKNAVHQKKRHISETVRKPKYEDTPQSAIDLVLKNVHKITKKLYSNKDGNNVYLYGCEKCGKTFFIDQKNESDYDDCMIECPHCHNKQEVRTATWIRSYGYARAYDEGCETYGATLELNPTTNGLIARNWHVASFIDVEEQEMTTNVEEISRFQIEEFGNISIAKNRDNTWKKCDKLSIDTLIQSDEDLEQIINGSLFKYSGLLEICKNRKRADHYVYDVNEYLMLWQKDHRIELPMKAGLYRVSKDLVRHNRLQEGKTIEEMFGLPRHLMKILKDDCRTANFETYKSLKILYDNDHNFDQNMYNQLNEKDLIDARAVAHISAMLGITYRRIIDYTENVYMHQCIYHKETIGIWEDYLNMAQKVNIDLSDKNRRFPTSLKKEHDVVMFAYNQLKEQINAENFAANAKDNAEKFEFEDKDYVVIIPKTPQEVVFEATKQHNCLKSYIQRLCDGETVVAFVRKKEEPETPYITAEIRDGVLRQYLVKYNQRPREKAAVDFAKKWAEKKGFSTLYGY